MSESVGPISLNVYGSYPPPDAAGGGGGFGGTSYDAWNNALNAGSGSGSGATSSTTGNPPVSPGGISDPKTGRETPNAQIQFVSIKGDLLGTGTAQQLLDRLSSLLASNAAATKDFAGHPVPLLRLPDGTFVRFGSTTDVQNYLTRSAQPVVPTAAVAQTFQSVLGRPPKGQTSSRRKTTSTPASRWPTTASAWSPRRVASPEVASTLDIISRQVLNRGAGPTDLAADKVQLLAGKSMDDVRSGLAHSPEATVDVAGLFQSVLGRDASGPDITGREAGLAGGGSLDALRQDLASSPEARNEVAAAFKAELGRSAPEPNTADMQRTLAARDGSIDKVRSYLAGTTEAGTDLIALYQYGLGRAPTASELTAAQAALAQDGSLRDTYQSLGGMAGAGLVGNADQFSAMLRQAQQLGGGAQSAGQRALQGVLSWAARNGPALNAGGVAGAILLTPLNSQQVTTEAGVAGHPELGARYQRAPGSISGSVTLYLRGPDGQPAGDGLKLDMEARGQLTGPAGTAVAGLLFGTLPPGAMDGGVQLASGLDAMLPALQTVPGSGITVRNQEKADLVASMQAQGKSTQEIEAALDSLRLTDKMRNADPARVVEGPGRLSNPDEVENIRQAIEALGMTLVDRAGRLEYQPGVKPG